MKKLIIISIAVSFSLSFLHGEDVLLGDVNLEGFVEIVSNHGANDKKFSQEELCFFYQKNKANVWGVENEREFWKVFTPLVLSYEDKEFVTLILDDRGEASYGAGVMFGWHPMVWAPLKSKLPYVLQLIYFSDGVTGISFFYSELEKEIESKASIEIETKNRLHPLAKFDILTGLVCCFPKVSGRTEKLTLATVTMEYFEKLFEQFLETADPESNVTVITGLRNGLFNYYFYSEGEENPPGRENTDFWPNKEECFDLRSYYSELARKDGELLDEENEFIERFREMQRVLGW